jgi:hypothetical protein
VLQFLQAEKSIRIRSLVKDGFNMTEIKEIFAGAEEKISEEIEKEVEIILEMISEFNFIEDISADGRSTIYNYAGYASRGLLHRKQIKCLDCVEMIAQDSKSFDQDSPDEEYCALISRGGLCKPSDIVFTTCLHAYTLWRFIRNDSEIYDSFMGSHNQRHAFVECFDKKITECQATAASICNSTCRKGHDFRPYIKRIAATVFNCMMVNLCNETNSEIHAAKKRKGKGAKKLSTSERKIMKLTSGSSSLKKVSESSKEDCGACKYCKDKKKFGGPGKLKQKCAYK